MNIVPCVQLFCFAFEFGQNVAKNLGCIQGSWGPSCGQNVAKTVVFTGFQGPVDGQNVAKTVLFYRVPGHSACGQSVAKNLGFMLGSRAQLWPECCENLAFLQGSRAQQLWPECMRKPWFLPGGSRAQLWHTNVTKTLDVQLAGFHGPSCGSECCENLGFCRVREGPVVARTLRYTLCNFAMASWGSAGAKIAQHWVRSSVAMLMVMRGNFFANHCVQLQKTAGSWLDIMTFFKGPRALGLGCGEGRAPTGPSRGLLAVHGRCRPLSGDLVGPFLFLPLHVGILEFLRCFYRKS